MVKTTEEATYTKLLLSTLKALVYNGHKEVSKSLIQRKMKIGFNKSDEILKDLVASQIVMEIDGKHVLCWEFCKDEK